MLNYLNESNQKFEVENSFKPIENIKKDTWESIDDNLKKVYKFKKTKHLEASNSISETCPDNECNITPTEFLRNLISTSADVSLLYLIN